MSAMKFQVAQAAQQKVPGGLIGFYGATVADGVFTAEFGVATAEGRQRVLIAVGAGSRIGEIGYLEVLDVRVGGEGERSHALLRFTPTESGEGS
jgi:hypothetical protein